MVNTKGFNGPSRKDKKTPLLHQFEDAGIKLAIEKLQRGETLTPQEDALLLSPSETAQVLSIVKGQPVSVRYIPQLIRYGKLTPDAQGSGRAYLYRMSKVRSVDFGKVGAPKKTNA